MLAPSNISSLKTERSEVLKKFLPCLTQIIDCIRYLTIQYKDSHFGKLTTDERETETRNQYNHDKSHPPAPSGLHHSIIGSMSFTNLSQVAGSRKSQSALYRPFHPNRIRLFKEEMQEAIDQWFHHDKAELARLNPHNPLWTIADNFFTLWQQLIKASESTREKLFQAIEQGNAPLFLSLLPKDDDTFLLDLLDHRNDDAETLLQVLHNPFPVEDEGKRRILNAIYRRLRSIDSLTLKKYKLGPEEIRVLCAVEFETLSQATLFSTAINFGLTSLIRHCNEQHKDPSPLSIDKLKHELIQASQKGELGKMEALIDYARQEHCLATLLFDKELIQEAIKTEDPVFIEILLNATTNAQLFEKIMKQHVKTILEGLTVHSHGISHFELLINLTKKHIPTFFPTLLKEIESLIGLECFSSQSRHRMSLFQSPSDSKTSTPNKTQAAEDTQQPDEAGPSGCQTPHPTGGAARRP